MSYMNLQSDILFALVKTSKDLEYKTKAELGISTTDYRAFKHYFISTNLVNEYAKLGLKPPLNVDDVKRSEFGIFSHLRNSIKSRELSVFKYDQIKNVIKLLASPDIWGLFKKNILSDESLSVDRLNPKGTYFSQTRTTFQPRSRGYVSDIRLYNIKITLLKSIFLAYGYDNRFDTVTSNNFQFYSSYCNTSEDLRLILQTCDYLIEKGLIRRRNYHSKIEKEKRLLIDLKIDCLRYVKRVIQDIEKLLLAKLQIWVNLYPDHPEIIERDKTALFHDEFSLLGIDQEEYSDGYLSIWALRTLTGLKKKSFLNEQRNKNLLQEKHSNERLVMLESNDLGVDHYYEFNSANAWLDSKKIDCEFHGLMAVEHISLFDTILDSYNKILYEAKTSLPSLLPVDTSVLTTHKAKAVLNVYRNNNQELAIKMKNIWNLRYKEFFLKYPHQSYFAALNSTHCFEYRDSKEEQFLEKLIIYLKDLHFQFSVHKADKRKERSEEILIDIKALEKQQSHIQNIRQKQEGDLEFLDLPEIKTA